MSAAPRAEEAAEHRLAARVTTHEKHRVADAAWRAGKTVSDFVRDAVLRATTKIERSKPRSVTRIKK